jgi:DNA-binding CsgD family transcriptional regulator
VKRQIMHLVCEGRSNKEVEGQLYLSEGTVKANLHRTYQKLAIQNWLRALKSAIACRPDQIDPARIEGFGRLMRHNLTNGSVPFRKAYLRSIIHVVEVDDTSVRIKGSKDVLERAVLADPPGENLGSQMSTGWRATVDEDGHYVFAIFL